MLILVPKFPTKILAPDVVSIAFSFRPEEALLMMTSQKLVWIYFHYFQFCFAMWITYIINQQNEKFSYQNYGTRFGKYSIFPKTQRRLLVLTLQMLVWIYFHYFQFCFAMWITYIINQQNEKSTLYKTN